MLGLGERSGGVPTEEIAVALECLYGVDTGMHLDKLREVGRVFEEAAGITLPGHKPVIGRNSFTYEAGVAAMFSYRLHKEGMPLGTVPYLPELVGGRFGIVIGKKAGKYNILWKLEEAGKTASEEAITRIVARVKERAIQERRGLTETEFVEICGEVLSRL